MIITAVDDKYLDEAETLIRSCARHAPDQGFYLFLVNSTEDRIAPLREVHPKLIVEHVKWPYEPDRWRGLMCSARTGPILNVLEKYREPTLYLDSDTIVMAGLDEVFGELETHDLLVLHRPDTHFRGAAGSDAGGKFNSGVIAIRPSDVGLDFAREYHRRIQEWNESGKPICYPEPPAKSWSCVDQEFLYLIYEEFGKRLKFKALPRKFNDAQFDPDSIVWHGKGTARKRPQYVQAKLSYGNRARYYAYFLVGYPLRLAYYVVRRLKARRKPV